MDSDKLKIPKNESELQQANFKESDITKEKNKLNFRKDGLFAHKDISLSLTSQVIEIDWSFPEHGE